jgi:hypothetical protein
MPDTREILVVLRDELGEGEVSDGKPQTEWEYLAEDGG